MAKGFTTDWMCKRKIKATVTSASGLRIGDKVMVSAGGDFTNKQNKPVYEIVSIFERSGQYCFQYNQKEFLPFTVISNLLKVN